MLTFLDGVLFRTKRFRPDYRYTHNFLSTLEVDEVVLVDLGGSRERFHGVAREYIDGCFSPATVGGKVAGLAEVDFLFRVVGADKVLVKADRLALIGGIAARFGRQAVVAGVDYSKSEDALPLALEAENAGAGEILLTSIERDGSLQGYDLEALEAVAAAVHVPVVVSGGCGSWEHMRQGLEAGASGVATSVIHHFTSASLQAAKSYLGDKGVRIRA